MLLHSTSLRFERPVYPPNRFCNFERNGVMASSTGFGNRLFTVLFTRRNSGGRMKVLK